MIPTVEDILIRLQTGDISREQAIGWIEIHLNDQRAKQQYHDQDRRRRVFEEVALKMLRVEHVGQCCLTGFPKESIVQVANEILSEADAFATKETK